AVRGLSDEYKVLVNTVGLTNANLMWAKQHPDKLFYEVPESQVGVKGGYVQATADSLRWMTDHRDFMTGYSGVAAYFLPPADQTGDFDYGAYTAELQLGLRQKKTTEDYFDDVTNANASQEYFDRLNERDQQIANDPSHETEIRKVFDDWKTNVFFKAHPVFA